LFRRRRNYGLRLESERNGRGQRSFLLVVPTVCGRDHTVRQTSFIRQPGKGEPRPTRRLPAPADDQSSAESGRGHDTGRLGKLRKSQPEGGRRFTSQTGRRHYGTLDQLAPQSRRPIQVGGSAAGILWRVSCARLYLAGSVARRRVTWSLASFGGGVLGLC